MDHFREYQTALEEMFPSLTVFSDLNWDEVAREYIASHETRPQDLEDFTFNFPQYLQNKAEEGDCPSYLFELAYYELLKNQIIGTDLELPSRPGIYLNPTVSFLNLEFDVGLMIDEATKGSVQIFQRPHVLCLYKNPVRGLQQIEITTRVLEVLQELEEGPRNNRQDLPQHCSQTLNDLIQVGVVVEVQ